MNLSVIIVNYNVKYFLEQALWSVRKAARNITLEIFVVDNNSVDDSVAMVKEKFPEVKLIINTSNVGFAVANNQAIRKAGGKYILLLNPDTLVEEDTFEKCLRFMDDHPRAGGLGVKMIDGSGKFLPESKRGFPSPMVAFSKAFGLSKIFPRSKIFNHYHLGYLDPDELHRIEVLAGAFMLLRKSVLDEVGGLDEAFFMYGEDIDLSYRIVEAGYDNYYFPDTKIIHYKGESTKKGSLNYVRIFYQAMIIFARKHFSGEKARVYIGMLQLAIYFRAAITVMVNVGKKIYLPVLDAALIFLGMIALKNFWAVTYFNDPDYYQPAFVYFNIPLYISIWLGTVYFSGAYDEPHNFRRLVRGLVAGTLILAAVYGFLDMAYRTSRVLILLGAGWALIATTLTRMAIHFVKFRNLKFGQTKNKKFVIIGKQEEKERVLNLVNKAQLRHHFIGTVTPGENADAEDAISDLQHLDEVVRIYKIDEIIFCSKDISAQQIMYWMTRLGSGINYKIVPEESLSIIGSHSKNTTGELYTIDIRFRIAQFMNRRNKRLLDLMLCLVFLLTLPLMLMLIPRPLGLIKNIFAVLAGKKSWVGYAEAENVSLRHLPPGKMGVLTPLDEINLPDPPRGTAERLNLIYARDYSAERDVDIIIKGWRQLGRSSPSS